MLCMMILFRWSVVFVWCQHAAAVPAVANVSFIFRVSRLFEPDWEAFAAPDVPGLLSECCVLGWPGTAGVEP